MNFVATFDIGSTYTKACYIDVENGRLLSNVSRPTSASTDVSSGIEECIRLLEAETNLSFSDVLEVYTSSSAAGGLRVAAIGLVPELTLKATKIGCLGSGAKIVGSYSNGLSYYELEDLMASEPDLIVLSGGFDGGNSEAMIKSAEIISESSINVQVIIAGNKHCAPIVKKILQEGGVKSQITENILPEIDTLNVKPLEEAIRKTFEEEIINAKGIEKVKKFTTENILPTPLAVLRAATLLFEGTAENKGFEDLMVVDIGGATTDVHSVAKGTNLRKVVVKGMPEPLAKRTVEGDLGLRINAKTIVEQVGVAAIIQMCAEIDNQMKLNETNVKSYIERIGSEVMYTPQNKTEQLLDAALAEAAIKVAVKRHVGSLEKVMTIEGEKQILKGKDLTKVSTVIGVGGIMAHNVYRRHILRASAFSEDDGNLLKPSLNQVNMLFDNSYLLFASGLLADKYKNVAMKLLYDNLK
jgi:uncharacterized protein (TIGR01319 family)